MGHEGNLIYFIENPLREEIREVRWSPDGSLLPAPGRGTVRWDAATGEEVSVYQSSERIYSVA